MVKYRTTHAMIDLAHQLPKLDTKLITLLESLSPEAWHKQTIAKLWTVKDVAAHLLDGNIRILSALRDGHFGEAPEIHSYQDLVQFLNGLNAEWVAAMKRVSPDMLIALLKFTGPMYCQYYASLDPESKAVFPVAWTGESESTNRMHIAREYTEKFLHQQQIRDAVGQQGILTAEFFHPFLEVCMYGLPHTLHNVQATDGAVIALEITGEGGGTWYVRYTGTGWKLIETPAQLPVATVTITSDASWKLFSKSLRATDLMDQITIYGDQALGMAALELVAFMA